MSTRSKAILDQATELVVGLRPTLHDGSGTNLYSVPVEGRFRITANGGPPGT